MFFKKQQNKIQSEEYLVLFKEIETLKVKLEHSEQKLNSLRALVNRKLGYTDESSNDNSVRSKDFNSGVILPM